MAVSPVALLGPRLLAGVYYQGTYSPPPPLPRVSVLTTIESFDRNSSLATVKTVRLVRTSPVTDQCSVEWAITGTGVNPVTPTYFVPSTALPSGLATFQPGDLYVDIDITVSPGAAPASDLFGVFTVFGPSGCSILASQSSFQFRILEATDLGGEWSWAEPTWVPAISYAAAPNKVQITTLSGLDELATMDAGKTYVLNGTLDGGGADFSVSGTGSASSPIRIMANGGVGNATLKNCTLKVQGASYVSIYGLNLEGVQVEFRGANSMVQFERNELSNYNNPSDKGAIVIVGTSKTRYLRFYGNEFKSKPGKIFDSAGITTTVISPKTTTDHYKYIWIERNLFKDFTRVYGVGRFAFFMGQANPDANKNCFLTIKDNLILDSDNKSIFEIKIAGNMRMVGNTFEITKAEIRPYTGKIRFGSIKERFGVMPTGALRRAHGALIEGNMFVTPAGTTYDGGSIRVKDAGHRIVHNWGVRLAPGAQPTVSSPLNGSSIGLGFGNMDMTWWPENEDSGVAGRRWINTGWNTVAGNRMTVEVGSEENSINSSETIWPAVSNTVAPASAARSDRNAVVTLYSASRQTGTKTNVLVPGVSYNKVPVRILQSTCGRNAP